MKQHIDEILDAYESGRMSRRQLIIRLAAAAAIGGAAPAVAGQRNDRQAKEADATATAEERRPFEEIARRKGVKITFDAPVRAQARSEDIHLDMDMVEESLRNAIKRTGAAGHTSIQAKLEWLLKSGTDAEKVEFVLGSGTYYFPGDVEKLAKLSRLSGGKSMAEGVCRRVCTPVYYWVCRCVQSRDDQECRETARDFCEIYCP